MTKIKDIGSTLSDLIAIEFNEKKKIIFNKMWKTFFVCCFDPNCNCNLQKSN